jgi:fatty acid desaturase
MTQVTTLNRGTPAALGTADWPLTGWDIVPAAMLKSLRKRSNGPGLRYFAAHLTALAVTGAFVHLALGTWMVLPAMFAHGTVIVLLFAPLHECSHFTAFRTRWLNYAVGMLVGFISIRPFLYFKWRHAEHHTYTQSPHSDPDHVPSPRSLVQYAGLIVGAELWPKLIGSLWRGATGRYNAQERRFIPTSELDRVSAEIRVAVVLYAAIVIASVAAQSWVAVVYWLLPRVIAEPVLRMIRMAEHIGAEETPNLLRNARTTLAGPVIRLLYWNMSFHSEHHVAPSVPFHALRELHGFLRPHLGYVADSYWSVHREILSCVLRERS